jgi:hypothetical protein|mmetsp:Transcript_56127/g.168005  ORF Transcript_56127/g.168005 Transcript_56127/m.168005 type:complete len:314 (-) Transcript_56127:72-1013(-)|eukprot:CAMPEP_0113563862 /NCGR_PEP_ID=MMETSP0015_2-20120614/21300_1 /TAXON_ID=2838 /ORGANISM="Odontella" /LENGTH=313 /DNA_ID=CAMNT_0000465881 /DNA_START=123 /DNA_END=1064 /DNA_ORIENTATION=- /assembly_acc=CAM_ASM_000160
MKLYGAAILAFCASSGVSAFSLSMSTPLGVGTRAPGVGVAGSAPRGAGARAPAPAPRVGGDMQRARQIWDNTRPITVQGGSLRTFSFATPTVDAVQVSMRTEGRPLNANVDLWVGPDNTPQKMGIYLEDGDARPFNAVIATPGGQNTVAIRNTAQMEFPLVAVVEADSAANAVGLTGAIRELDEMTSPTIIQGGALKTYSFSPYVASVQILLKTDGRPLNARIELLQGPNNNKQVMEIYTEDGTQRPFYSILETPGVGNVVRLVNTAPMEFPLTARVEPFSVDERSADDVMMRQSMGDRDPIRQGFNSFGMPL